MPDDRSAPSSSSPSAAPERPTAPSSSRLYDLSPLEVDGIRWSFLAEDARPLTPDLLRRLDGLYHYSAPVTKASLEGVDRLVLLARHGVGLDFVDLEACTRRGIGVTITPQGTTRPMASAAVALVLACSNRLRERDGTLHEGDWGPRRSCGPGLAGRTLGAYGGSGARSCDCWRHGRRTFPSRSGRGGRRRWHAPWRPCSRSPTSSSPPAR
jgi:hypothetical protein